MFPPQRNCLAIALTGGIASGKSTVQGRFAELGAPVFDADLISRELVEPGTPALGEIVAKFGAAALDANGGLDRRRMRERIFADPSVKLTLEQILHPSVRSELIARARACDAPYCVLAIPLLAESAGDYEWVDRILVVDVPRSTQLDRLMRRDGMTNAFAEGMLAAQAKRGERLRLADDVVDNTFDAHALVPVVERLDRRYLDVARRASRHSR